MNGRESGHASDICSAAGLSASGTLDSAPRLAKTSHKQMFLRLQQQSACWTDAFRAMLLGSGLLLLMMVGSPRAGATENGMLIDDFTDPKHQSRLGTSWRNFSDRVMGGVSESELSYESVDGRSCLRLTGDVRLENNGGFVQAALDLGTWGRTLDASAFTGIELEVRGNDERYSVHLRTPDNVRPWQSYRAQFIATPEWRTVKIPFADFTPYRLDKALDLSRLRRIGLVAIGRAFTADLAVCRIAFY